MTKVSTPPESKSDPNGLLVFELSSLAAGYKLANDLGSKVSVELLECSVMSPGKFFILVRGNENDLKTLSEKSRYEYQRDWIDEGLAPDGASFILPAFYNLNKTALGQFIIAVEGETLSSSIQAAALASKTKGVEILDFRNGRGIGGKSLLLFTGQGVSLDQLHKLREQIEGVRNILHVELIENVSKGLKNILGDHQ